MHKIRKLEKLSKNDKGFTLLEMAVSIPLMALTAGFMVFIAAQSMATIKQTATVNDASIRVNTVLSDVDNAQTCSAVNEILTKPVKVKDPSRDPYTIKTTIVSEAFNYPEPDPSDAGGDTTTPPEEEFIPCYYYSNLKITSTATSDKDGTVLFYSSTRTTIMGDPYGAIV